MSEIRSGDRAGIAREASARKADTMPMVRIQLAAGTWAEVYEPGLGSFRERILEQAFAAAIKRNSKPKILFQHGQDPYIGQKILAPAQVAFADGRGLIVAAGSMTPPTTATWWRRWPPANTGPAFVSASVTMFGSAPRSYLRTAASCPVARSRTSS